MALITAAVAGAEGTVTAVLGVGGAVYYGAIVNDYEHNYYS